VSTDLLPVRQFTFPDDEFTLTSQINESIAAVLSVGQPAIVTGIEAQAGRPCCPKRSV